jgi:hypothetical protein
MTYFLQETTSLLFDVNNLCFKLTSKLVFQKILGAFKFFWKAKYSKFSNNPRSNNGNTVLLVNVKRVVRNVVKSCTKLK